ncbi:MULTISPECIES: branched-chain amino acid ABC transporter substrate-binding protein [unclassified Acidovorax]|uniref:branched-chain amino acid ABC transporter substrate-binding protein n=1 Tax=unclassified Acidovorax TaxID=2684926 RepID=UPI000BC609DF|nr:MULTISPECIES: branched-chain amino acid ABC transporter substrate-binding protein [unclassified Acidovorax]OZA57930.1 MAG: branched-chain amino acid ABC transporter substrate-binding protein [Acidovorax sp. 17-64-282]HQS64845.1 branched-chain amino acid ABC transporter substrate-binding protein [Acidovorax defluvii]OYY26094.1 MAG: branched-chain amino acid ABC transporter substrate-binding protein [Acidovorax sp. 35-64-16]OYY85263.1 MAG: branched-chain amino acid ABC transporter substrate-bi
MTSRSSKALRILVSALALTAALPSLAATKVTIAVVSLDGDPRHAVRRMEKAYPGHPTGRAVDGVKLAAEDSAFELDAAGIELVVKDVVLPNAAGLDKALAELKAAKVQHVVADLPATALRALVQAAPAALGGAIVFNSGLDDDALRGTQCAAQLLHTYPSRAMLSDALAQYLAARNWRKALVLQGPLPGDALLLEAFNRSAKRYGIKPTASKPFKLTGDPRERELGNVRLLTGSDREHEVVAVLDSDGEFARTVPYATQLPRPVVGANGLVALAWHPLWDRNGGPQLSRRFAKAARRPMSGHDWAAWMAGRAIATVLADQPKATVAQQLKALRGGAVAVDGFKGPRLSFRVWDGQLRQPIFLGHADGVVGIAPLDGVLHPREVMDTLGVDEAESACKQRP